MVCLHLIFRACQNRIYQGCVTRSFGAFNTVKYTLNMQYAYNTIVLSKQFWECRFLTQSGPVLGAEVVKKATNRQILQSYNMA
jgi:hypothetical protein